MELHTSILVPLFTFHKMNLSHYSGKNVATENKNDKFPARRRHKIHTKLIGLVCYVFERKNYM